MSSYYEREAIKKFGNVYRKYSDTEWLFPCKLCRKPNNENLHVNVKTGLYNCFHNCSNHGRLGKHSYSLQDLIKHKNNSSVDDNKQQIFIDNYYNKIEISPFHRMDLTEYQLQALHNRGITDDLIKYYNISGGKRIQIPNYVVGGFSDIICMWEPDKEKISKYNPKYLYNEGIKKSNSLFNIHNISSGSDIILCEGIFNAITAGKNAVASYGCNLSDIQLLLMLSKSPASITIAYDSDLPGVNGSMLAIQKLKKQRYAGNVYYILLPKGIDINDMGHDAFVKYLYANRKCIDLTSALSCNIPKLIFNNLN